MQVTILVLGGIRSGYQQLSVSDRLNILYDKGSMRLCFYVASQEIGGYETQLRLLFQQLRTQDSILIAPPGIVRNYLSPWAGKILNAPLDQADWNRLIGHLKPDVGLSTQGSLFAFSAACRQHQVPVGWFCGFPFTQYPPIEKQILLTLLDFVIVCSDYLKAQIDHPKTFTLPVAFEAERFQKVSPTTRNTLRKKLGFSQDTNLLGYAARPTPHKRHAFLLNLFEKLSRQEPYGLLLLFPPGSTEIPKFFSLRNPHIRSLCAFENFLPDFFSAMDLYVSPATQEGFGLAVLQALAGGLPVIAAKGSGMDEALHCGDLGMLLEAEDTDGFCKAIQNYKKRKTTADYSSILEKYQPVTLGKNFLSLIENLPTRG